jgi:transcriptional regulator with PAS, ATPase and Fis domain
MRFLPLTALHLGPAEQTDEYWFAAGGEPQEAWRTGAVALGLTMAAGHSSSAYRDLPDLADALLSLSSERPPSGAAVSVPDWPSPEPLDAATRRLYRQALRVAANPLHVLIRGESGTGKELLAQFVHRHSEHADRPWVAVNCAAFAEDLLEAELFGVERGVATGVEARAGLFERADGGTLFLDEIGDMALATQARILRVLQSQEVWRLGANKARPARFRMISATHKDLAELRRQGAFRDDLWHRIADWEACLPPLRERLDDIGNLALYFLGCAASRRGVAIRGITRRALSALLNYDWPGNIRELEREMQRCAVFLDHGAALTAEDLRPAISANPPGPANLTLASQLQRAEQRIIELALRRRAGDIDATAAELGISRATLYRRMAAHRIADQPVQD